MEAIRYKGKGEHSIDELESIIEQKMEELHLINSGQKQLRIAGVSQQRELLIAYNVEFYKGLHDVTLKQIEGHVDKYLSNL